MKTSAMVLLAVLMAPLVATGSDQPGTPDPVPNATLTPDEVVRIQLEALRTNDTDDHGIEICFRFASPGNKANTGPLDRFARMIKDGPYSLMLRYRDADYESVEIKDRYARQRVTLTDPTESITYVFYLSRQSQADCQGCWMTDSVNIVAIQSPV